MTKRWSDKKVREHLIGEEYDNFERWTYQAKILNELHRLGLANFYNLVSLQDIETSLNVLRIKAQEQAND